jgi:hypothetical protein
MIAANHSDQLAIGECAPATGISIEHHAKSARLLVPRCALCNTHCLFRLELQRVAGDKAPTGGGAPDL